MPGVPGSCHDRVHFAADRPLAWIDADLHGDACGWASMRRVPTKALSMDPSRGIIDRDVRALLALRAAMSPGGRTPAERLGGASRLRPTPPGYWRAPPDLAVEAVPVQATSYSQLYHTRTRWRLTLAFAWSSSPTRQRSHHRLPSADLGCYAVMSRRPQRHPAGLRVFSEHAAFSTSTVFPFGGQRQQNGSTLRAVSPTHVHRDG